MKNRLFLYLILIFIVLGSASCGGGSSKINNQDSSNSNDNTNSNTKVDINNPNKASRTWEINRENRVQTFSSFAAAIDIVDMFEIKELNLDKFENSDCYLKTDDNITFKNCKLETDYKTVYYNGVLQFIKDNNSSKGFKIENFRVKTENRGEVHFDSGEFTYDSNKSRYGYHNISLEAFDTKGNSVKWNNFSFYTTKDYKLVINGKVASSITYNLWFTISSSSDFVSSYKDGLTPQGYFIIKGDNNSHMKFEFNKDEIYIYVNSELIEVCNRDEIDEIYDKRDEYLKH